jgi:hypothetical protein
LAAQEGLVLFDVGGVREDDLVDVVSLVQNDAIADILNLRTECFVYIGVPREFEVFLAHSLEHFVRKCHIVGAPRHVVNVGGKDHVKACLRRRT